MITFPRGKAKHKSDTKIEDIYKYYLKNRINNNTEIKQTLFTSVLTDYNDHKTNQTVYRNLPFQLPYLGRLEIIKYKPKARFINNKVFGYPVNFKKTKELWEKDSNAKAEKRVVLHLNEESDKYLMFWKWVKSVHLVNQTVYRFVPLRKIKQKIPTALKTTNYNIDFYTTKY